MRKGDITGAIIAELFWVEGLVHAARAEPEEVGEGNAGSPFAGVTARRACGPRKVLKLSILR